MPVMGHLKPRRIVPLVTAMILLFASYILTVKNCDVVSRGKLAGAQQLVLSDAGRDV
jgi:hypothetical protein